jgi:hypothetical protein
MHSVAVAAHVALVAAVTAMLHAAIDESPAREIAIGVAAAPLLATLPGLWRRNRAALPWIAVLLVPFVGGAIIEVVATSGAGAADVALFAALAELALVLALIRRGAVNL